MVEVRDGARWRSVAYQMHLSEVFVPYMDPDQAWYWRTYMDSGEYGFGNLLSPLRPGVDCPAYARFLPVTMPQDNGEPMSIPNAICLFERSIGDPAWRHYEMVGNTPQNPKPTVGRPANELVVRSASAIGNYDYLVDYVFRQDGSIRIAIGATGIDATKGVASQSMKDATAAADTRHGTLIAPGLVAPFHSHYFNFRLDLDIDGTANDFMRERLVQQSMPEGLPRRSIFAVTHEMPASEQAARSRIDPASPALYHFGNHNVESALGHHPGYMLMPEGSYVHPLLAADDPPVRRNSYLHYQLSVTPQQSGGALRRRALRHDERWLGHAGRLDRARPADRQSRHRRLVHGRLSPHHADGGLACDADPLVRLHADAAQFLRDEPGDDDPGCEVAPARLARVARQRVAAAPSSRRSRPVSAITATATTRSTIACDIVEVALPSDSFASRSFSRMVWCAIDERKMQAPIELGLVAAGQGAAHRGGEFA